MEKRGVKVTGGRLRVGLHVCLNGTPTESVKMHSAQLSRVIEFKYMGSTQSGGGVNAEVNERTQCVCGTTRKKVSGVLKL